MSDTAIPGRLSGVVPSPQSTVMPVTVAVLETVKVRLTVWPVLAGLGTTPVMVTTGGLTAVTVTIIDWDVDPVLPELSVTVNMTMKVVVAAGL